MNDILTSLKIEEEVCCNPIEIKYQSDGNDITNFSAISIEQ